MNKIYKKNNKLVIEILLETQRSDPYDDTKYGKMDNILAMINEFDMGFCYKIDMEYKGKPDQYTDLFYKYMGSEEDFRKLCKELNIEIL